MSLRVALQAVGLLVVGYALFAALLGMGPVAWAVFGTMLAIGALQVYRKRSREAADAGDPPQFCVDCGAELDPDPGADGSGSREVEVNYCGACGAPVPSAGESDPGERTVNCAECGAPNDADRSACDYCGAPL
ncbi:MAG: zinc ribbon domain-containing protein [Haloferacaceae archaeon]